MIDFAQLAVRFASLGADKVKEDIQAIKKEGTETEAVSEKAASAISGRWAVALLGLGAAAVIAGVRVKNELSAFKDRADDLNHMAQETNMAASELSQWDYIAKLSGVTLDQFSQSVQLFSSKVAKAGDDSSDTAKLFRAMGVEVKDQYGNFKSTNDILLQTADRFAIYRNDLAKTNLARELFGRSGARLLEALNTGKIGLEEFMNEAKAMGIVVSDDAATAADKLNDSITKLHARSTAWATELGNFVIPKVVALMDALSKGPETTTVEGRMKALEERIKSLTNQQRGLRGELTTDENSGAFTRFLSKRLSEEIQPGGGPGLIGSQAGPAPMEMSASERARNEERIATAIAKARADLAAMTPEFQAQLEAQRQMLRRIAEHGPVTAPGEPETALGKWINDMSKQTALLGKTKYEQIIEQAKILGASPGTGEKFAAEIRADDIKKMTDQITVQTIAMRDGESAAERYRLKIQGLTSAQIEAAMALRESERGRQRGLALQKAEEEQRDHVLQSINEYQAALAQIVVATEQEYQNNFRSRIEVEKLTKAATIRAAAQAELNRIEKFRESQGLDPSAVEGMRTNVIQSAQRAIDAMNGSIDKQEALRTDWSFGWEQAWKKFQSDANDAIKGTQELFDTVWGAAREGFLDLIFGVNRDWKQMIAGLARQLLALQLNRAIANNRTVDGWMSDFAALWSPNRGAMGGGGGGGSTIDAGSSPNMNVSSGRGITVNQTNNIGAGVTKAELNEILRQHQSNTIATIQDMASRRQIRFVS